MACPMTVLLLLLVAAVVLVGYANGANDNFKSVATVYGSSTLSYRAALGLATVAQLTGSVVSVFVAGALVSAFGGKGLLPDEVVAEPSFLLAVAVGAAVTVLAATRLGLPVSTTHALIGGLVGAGLAIAPDALSWGSLGGRYAVPLLLSPVAAMGLAGLLAMGTLVASSTSCSLSSVMAASPGEAQLARSFCPKAKPMASMPSTASTGNRSLAACLR